jgi:LysM repeat protein
MKKVIIIFLVLGVGGWLCYSNGVFSMVTGGRIASAQVNADGDPVEVNPYEVYDKGDYDAAIAILSERVKTKGDTTPEDLHYLGLAWRAKKDNAKARKAWTRLQEEFSSSPFYGDACYGLAELSREAGQKEGQMVWLEKAATKSINSQGGTRAALCLGKLYLEAGNKCKARVAYSRALPVANDTEKVEIKKILAKLNEEVIFSPVPNAQAPVYCVKAGDSLGRIARRFGTTIGMIKSVNKLRDNTIFPGDRLKIVKGTVHLEAYKSLFLLSLYIDGVWIKDYPIGIGSNDKTPEGVFVIETKIVNPPWHFRGKVYPPGDSQNVLGSRWMGFKRKTGLFGFGIHGTVDPASVPGAVSRGCLRMLNPEVEEIFEIVPRGTKIVIRS